MTDEIPDIKLTTEQVATLRQAQPQVTRLRQLIARAKRAGLPVDDLSIDLERMERARVGMLKEFGPPEGA